MPASMKDFGIDQLGVEDRLALAEEIWESVAAEVEAAPLTEAQRRELERRLADSIARPDAVTPWEVVKARALARAKR
ncbi:MAG TPA: addiction module protein [Fimbriiglobus sp.]|nr:addiction module protein [Fimbriiglobus sp.]